MADIGWVLKLILTAILLVVLGIGVLLLIAFVSSPELAMITSPMLASNTSSVNASNASPELAVITSPVLASNTSPMNASNASPVLALITSLEPYYDILGVLVFSVVFMIIGIAGLYWIYGPQEAKPVDL